MCAINVSFPNKKISAILVVSYKSTILQGQDTTQLWIRLWIKIEFVTVPIYEYISLDVFHFIKKKFLCIEDFFAKAAI